VNHLVQG